MKILNQSEINILANFWYKKVRVSQGDNLAYYGSNDNYQGIEIVYSHIDNYTLRFKRKRDYKEFTLSMTANTDSLQYLNTTALMILKGKLDIGNPV